MGTLKFGVPGMVVDIPAPLVGMGFEDGRDITEAKLSSGGRSVYAAPTTYKKFKMTWSAYDTALRSLLDMYRGNWGTQAFWLQDPTADPVNVLPARWGSSWQLSAVASGWCLPTVTSTSKGPQDLQVTFKQGTTSARSRTKGVLKTRVIRLPGQAYYFSCDFDSTGGAGIIVRGYDSTLNQWTDFATYATPQTNTVVVPSTDTKYTFIECDVYMPANSTLALRHVVLGYAPRWTMTRQNLALNPSFEAASGTVNVRTNLIQNPLCSSGWSSRWAGGGTASAAYSYPAGANPAGTSNYVHKTWTAGGGVTNGDTGFDDSAVGYTMSVTAGSTYTGSGYLRPSPGDKYGVANIYWFDASNNTISRTYGSNIALSQNAWTRVSVTATAPAGAVSAWLAVDIADLGAHWVTGDTLDMCGPLLELSSILGTYFDGTTAASGDFSYAWSGAANASTSYQQGKGIAGPGVVVGNSVAYQSTDWNNSRGHSCRITPTSATTSDSFVAPAGDTGGMRSGMVAGKTYTASATVRLAAPLTGTIGAANGALLIRFYYKDGSGNYQSFASSSAVNVAGSTRVSVTVTIPAGATEAFVRLYHGGLQGAGDVWWDDLLIEQSSTLGTYFDGTTAADTVNGFYYFWDGTADASTSEQVSAELPPTSFPSGTGCGAVQFIQNMTGTFKKVGWYGMTVDIEEIENGEGLSAIA